MYAVVCACQINLYSIFPVRESNSIFRFSEPTTNQAFRVSENKIPQIHRDNIYIYIFVSVIRPGEVESDFSHFSKFNARHSFVFPICDLQCASSLVKLTRLELSTRHLHMICLPLHIC